jgi:hypothetical protein
MRNMRFSLVTVQVRIYKEIPDDKSCGSSSVLRVRGVVGTLWEMKDADGPSIVEDFYGYMLRHGVDVKVYAKDSAKALNTAIQAMKKKGFIGKWVNFIHIWI